MYLVGQGDHGTETQNHGQADQVKPLNAGALAGHPPYPLSLMHPAWSWPFEGVSWIGHRFSDRDGQTCPPT